MITQKMGMREAVALLGQTPDEVALRLSQLGCQGKRGKGATHACPMSQFIDQHTDNPWGRGKVVEERYSWGDMQIVDFYWPKPVTEFIMGFDAGKYPWLEKRDIFELIPKPEAAK